MVSVVTLTIISTVSIAVKDDGISVISNKLSTKINSVIRAKGGPIIRHATLSRVRQTFWPGSVLQYLKVNGRASIIIIRN